MRQSLCEYSPSTAVIETEKLTDLQQDYQSELDEGQISQRSLVAAVNAMAWSLTDWAAGNCLGRGQIDDELLFHWLNGPTRQAHIGLAWQEVLEKFHKLVRVSG